MPTLDPPAGSAYQLDGRDIGSIWYDPSWPETPWRAMPLGETAGIACSTREGAVAWLVGQAVECAGVDPCA